MDILDLWSGNLLSDVKKLYGTGNRIPLGEQKALNSLPSTYGQAHPSIYGTLPSMTQLDLDLECEGETT